MLQAVGVRAGAIMWATQELKNDMEIAKKAVRQNKLAVRVMGEKLKFDKEFVGALVKKDFWVFEYIEQQL